MTFAIPILTLFFFLSVYYKADKRLGWNKNVTAVILLFLFYSFRLFPFKDILEAAHYPETKNIASWKA